VRYLRTVEIEAQASGDSDRNEPNGSTPVENSYPNRMMKKGS